MNKKIQQLFLFILLITSFSSIANTYAADGWWNEEWGFRKKLTIDTTAATGIDIKDSPQNIPILVRLHSGNFGFFLDLKADGSDLRFISSDNKTALKFYIEKFDPINEMAIVWVQMPRVMGASSSEYIWMYYGNPNAVGGADQPGTYDVNQSLVFNFNADGTSPKDATAYKNNPNLFTAESTPASLIGAGANFKGNGVISIPDSPSLKMTPNTGWTVSMWVKITDPQKDAYLLQRESNDQSLTLRIDGTSVYALYISSAKDKTETPPSSITLGEWHHVALTIGSNLIAVYIDGIETAKAPALLNEMSGEIYIGNTAKGGDHFLVGEIDELGIAKVARTPAWLKAFVSSQGIDSKLLKYGEDEQSGGGGESGSYVKVLLDNVTIDGWVVIVMLVIMAAISWVVMVGKGLVIGKIRKDNQAFLEQFRKLDLDETSKLDESEKDEDKELEASPLAQALFGKNDHYQSSNIYQLYHTGVQELNSRMGKAVGAAVAGLSLQSIEAIRAAIDATLVRQSQKLNSQMVLLTIAISGGPFLGLLGTVVGVMITFAAIAETGDVNVAAIAPGIAAALVATVAGLAVAIPALFGYNYLASRVKEIVADMHVFTDEFITKVAEMHGREA